MKAILIAFTVLSFGFSLTSMSTVDSKVKVEAKDGQQVRFYNECSTSVDFYVKGSGGTTKYSVSSKSSKNVSVNPGDVILDSSRNEIVTITSSTDKVIVCE
ncbi:MAG: hypothetical protein KDC84_07320 [Crocinitomicaceae bacterium]|nr:hypothetical protein [Crocinitomicaceae bacterium]